MNDETRKALTCGAEMRGVVSKIVEHVRLLDLGGRPSSDLVADNRAAMDALRKIRRELTELGLFDVNFPLEPFEHEQLRDACRRIFGIWIANDVLDRKERP